MKYSIKATTFLKHITKATVAGIIQGVFLNEGLTFNSYSLDKKVFSIYEGNIFVNVDTTLCILRLNNVKNIISNPKETFIEIYVDDRIIQLSCSGRGIYFPKTICSNCQKQSKYREKLSELLKGDAIITLRLSKKTRREIVNWMKACKTPVVLFRYDKGLLSYSLFSPKEMWHEKSNEICKIANGIGTINHLLCSYTLKHVLQCINEEDDVILELRSKLPVIFRINNYVIGMFGLNDKEEEET